MSKEKLITFFVEGPDWEHSVSMDPEIFDDERAQLFEAGTLAIEKQMAEVKADENLNLGAVLLVRKTKTAKKIAMVNAYLCLLNIGQYALAETLRENYKKSADGKDLANDTIGYSF